MSAFESFQAFEFASVFVDVTVLGEDIDELQIVPLSSCVVVLIMGWSDLDATCSKLTIYHLISYHLEFSFWDERMQKLFSNDIFESRVLRMHSNCCITKHRFNSGSCNNHKFCGIFLQSVFKRNNNSKLHLLLVSWYIQ